MRTFLITLALIFVGTIVSAQTTQNISANGEILSEISIIADKDLEFGIMERGVDNTIVVADDEAGRFLMGIDEKGEILITFDLPTHLTHDNNSQVPLAFADNSAGYTTSNQSGQQSTLFNPNTPEPIDFNNSQRDWYIFIGGTATPDENAPAGSYSADISVTAEYN